jgi:uncharacterized protein
MNCKWYLFVAYYSGASKYVDPNRARHQNVCIPPAGAKESTSGRITEGGRCMREFIEGIVKALVDKPDQVEVKEVIGPHVTIYELRLAKEDIGKVIGRRGQNARAIRWILNAVSVKNKKNSVLEILD